MSEILFYLNRNNREEAGIPKIPGAFQLVYSNNFNTQLHYSGKKSGIHHLRNDSIEIFLIGNINFYKGFSPNLNLLLQNHKINHDELQRILRKINGSYCCFVFNNLSNQSYLITDYLGFYPLYIYKNETWILLSTELKRFTFFEKISRTIDHEAIFSYLYNGHLMLNQSWFQEIKRMRPSSIYTFNLYDHSIHQEYYWVWARKDKSISNKKEINETLVSLFTKGIEELDLTTGSMIGVSLSGGLESRWIAQVASKKFPLQAFTFSTGKNYESKLAENVARALHINHRNPEIEKANWLLNRLQAFWKTDGMLHLGHLHEAGIHAEIHASFTHCFHGFYGGGIYTNAKKGIHNLTNEIVKQKFAFNNSDPNVDDLFYQTGCLNPYTGDNKIRYQSAYSVYVLSNYCNMIFPFYNMDWLEFIFNYSIDDTFDGYSKLYLEVLNSGLDKNLLHIPWQRTGLAPKYLLLNMLSMRFKLPSIFEALAQKIHKSRHFINYHYFDEEIDHWIREFRSDIANLQLNYPLYTREQKDRKSVV